MGTVKQHFMHEEQDDPIIEEIRFDSIRSLSGKIAEDKAIVESGGFFSTANVEITANDEEQFVSGNPHYFVHLLRSHFYLNGEGAGDKSYMTQMQQEISRGQGLMTDGTTSDVYHWLRDRQSNYLANDQDSQPRISELARIFVLALLGVDYRNSLIQGEINFLLGEETKYEDRLCRNTEIVALSESEELELHQYERNTEEQRSIIIQILDQISDCDSFTQLATLKQSFADAVVALYKERITKARLQGFAKEFAKEISGKSESPPHYAESEKLIEYVEQELRREFLSIRVEIEELIALSLAQLNQAKSPIFARLIERARLAIEQNSAKNQDETEALIGALLNLSSTLGFDDFALRRRFEVDKLGAVEGISPHTFGAELNALSRQVESGMDFEGNGIQMYESIGEALEASGYPSLKNENVLINNDVIPREQLELLDGKPTGFKTEKGIFDVSSYQAVASHIGKNYSQTDRECRLVAHEDNLLLVSEYQLGGGLRMHEVADSNLANREQSGIGYVRVKALFLTDESSGKTIDLTTLVSNYCEVRYVPDISTSSFRAEYGTYTLDPSRFVQYADIVNQSCLFAFLHEVGHQIVSSHTDPVLMKRLRDFYSRSVFTLGSPAEMPEEDYETNRVLLIANERGASARALWIVRELKKRGININSSEFSEFIQVALQSYEKKYPDIYGSHLHFINK